MTEFRGVYPAIISPTDTVGGLNEGAFRAVMEDNIRSGAHGFWVAGGTGESVFLSEEENKRIAEITVDQNQGRINNIMHVGAATTAQAARQAEHAAKVGVEAICAVPPFFYGVSDEAIVAHYRVLGEAAGLPLFAYNLPRATGVEITPGLMRKLRDGVPHLKGLKHSGGNTRDTAAFVGMGLDCFIGSGLLTLPALTLGACGVIDGPICFAPELWVDIWNAYHEGDIPQAEAAQRKATEVHNYALSIDFPSGIKALCGARVGVDCGDPRLPLPPASDETKAALIDEAVRRGYLKLKVRAS